MNGSIEVVNDDTADLYVWVRDLNTSDQRLVLDGERLNAGDKQYVEVELNGDEEAYVTWLARRADDPSVEKEDGPLTLDDRGELEVNVFGAIRTDVATALSPTRRVGASRIQDPNAAEMLRPMLDKLFAPIAQYSPKLEYVEELVLQWGEAAADVNAATQVPSTIEENIVVYENDTTLNKSYDETVKVSTKRAFTYESRQTIQTSTDFKVGISIPFDKTGKLNSDLIQKNQVVIGSSTSQRFDTEVIIEKKEKWEVPPRTTHYLRTVVTKGLLVVPVKGRVVIDACIVVSVVIPPFNERRTAHPAWISNPRGLPNPADRLIDYSGTLINETYQRIEISHKDVPIDSAGASVGIFETGGWISSG